MSDKRRVVVLKPYNDVSVEYISSEGWTKVLGGRVTKCWHLPTMPDLCIISLDNQNDVGNHLPMNAVGIQGNCIFERYDDESLTNDQVDDVLRYIQSSVVEINEDEELA